MPSFHTYYIQNLKLINRNHVVYENCLCRFQRSQVDLKMGNSPIRSLVPCLTNQNSAWSQEWVSTYTIRRQCEGLLSTCTSRIGGRNSRECVAGSRPRNRACSDGDWQWGFPWIKNWRRKLAGCRRDIAELQGGRVNGVLPGCSSIELKVDSEGLLCVTRQNFLTSCDCRNRIYELELNMEKMAFVLSNA